MPIYQFKRESWEFYRVHAKTKEDALKVLEEALLSDDESDMEFHYDRTETAMEFEFDGEWPDSSRLKRNVYQNEYTGQSLEQQRLEAERELDAIMDSKNKKSKKKKKSPKIKKGDIVTFLANSMTEEQWELISQLRGLPIPENQKKKETFLNSLFKKTITKASAKSKGRNLQQWTCKMISEFTGLSWGKDEPIASREMGQSGADVRMSARARRLFPFTSECKSGNQWNLPAAIKQCQANLYPDTEWIVVLDRPSQTKEERIPPIVVIDGEVFFQILHRTGELVDLLRRDNVKN